MSGVVYFLWGCVHLELMKNEMSASILDSGIKSENHVWPSFIQPFSLLINCFGEDIMWLFLSLPRYFHLVLQDREEGRTCTWKKDMLCVNLLCQCRVFSTWWWALSPSWYVWNFIFWSHPWWGCIAFGRIANECSLAMTSCSLCMLRGQVYIYTVCFRNTNLGLVKIVYCLISLT